MWREENLARLAEGAKAKGYDFIWLKNEEVTGVCDVVAAARKEHEHCPGYIYVAVRTTHGDRIQQPCGTCAAFAALDRGETGEG